MPVKIPEHQNAVRFAFPFVPCRFLDCSNGRHENNSGQTYKDKGQLPRLDRAEKQEFSRAAALGVLGNHSAADVCHAGSEHNAPGENSERQAAPFPGEIVRDQRVCTGHKTRLADADAHAGKKQLPEGRSLAAENGHGAPQRNTRKQQVAPGPGIGKPAHRDAQKSIKGNKRKSRKQAVIRIINQQIRFNRFDKIGNDGPIYKGEGIT
jgi:hypothetical protein